MSETISREYVGDHEERLTADYKKAEHEAKTLLEKYNITKAPIDPESLAEAEGLDVVYSKFKPEISKKISGYIDIKQKKIVINKDISPNRMGFTIAHELAHYLLHRTWALSNHYKVMPRSNTYGGRKPAQEQEADAFASHLLVPRDILKLYKNYASNQELARMFAVSEDVIMHASKWL
ncbi:ImmA/IrrE family metallo-endopeptidase [Acetobacter sp. DsW_059]|uniref:ImmA/IrrE family metallo-endopeptidase n=1 Tax=Acetobacter sp. DsW_059 TaxID=1670661 RepID=UPI0013026750|nr:ImmA/IrrE family metallo-endopeptidase [Acetobacter sp. DsW_059]